MPTYHFIFNGVIRNSLGIPRILTAYRDGATVEEARLKLQEGYDHISQVKWKEVEPIAPYNVMKD